jgi:hypothetical protein
MMNETRTASMLQRVPVILAVTANSYGLQLKPFDSRKPQAAGAKRRVQQERGGDKPSAH